MKSLSPTNAQSLRVLWKRCDFRFALLLAALVVLFAAQGFAQEATILGTVTDPSGAAVANATITIANTETGVERTLPSNSDGQYVAPDLQIGHYTVRASASGFKAAEQKGITLNVGDRTRIDFKLQVGSAQEQVTVEASAIAVQTDSSEQSNVITGQQVTQLATNGRSLYELFALAPGASSIQTSRVGFTPVSGDSNVSINGQRAGHNLQLIDGGENLDRGGSSGSVMPSIDSIAEFRNMTSNYSAEYGLATAATISTVSSPAPSSSTPRLGNSSATMRSMPVTTSTPPRVKFPNFATTFSASTSAARFRGRTPIRRSFSITRNGAERLTAAC